LQSFVNKKTKDESKHEDEFDEDNAEYLVNEFIVTICQILCFPFAIDANEEVISRIYKIIKEFNLFNKILSACISNELTYQCDVPISLISRLVLTDEDLVQLMIDQLISSTQVSEYISNIYFIIFWKNLYAPPGELICTTWGI